MLFGCGQSGAVDIEGPFTGTTFRFAVTAYRLPADPTKFAQDMNDPSGRDPDNQLGAVVQFGNHNGIVTDAIPEMLASGALSPIVEITSDGLARPLVEVERTTIQ